MNKLILVNFKDGKQIKLDPKQIVSTSQIAKMTVQTPPNESSESKNELDILSQIDLGSSNSSDYFTESDADAGVRSILVEDFDEDEDQDEDSSDDEDAKSSQSQTSGDAGAKPKKKRQRLTHLSEEEKLARRKMKNRVAAQSARDRKKAKMDGLEEETKSLRVQNEKLRNENKLLKEKTKLLLDENRKLLGKLKQQATASPVGASVPASASVAVEAVASLQPRADSSSVISLKRKFDQMKTTRGVEESAAETTPLVISTVDLHSHLLHYESAQKRASYSQLSDPMLQQQQPAQVVACVAPSNPSGQFARAQAEGNACQAPQAPQDATQQPTHDSSLFTACPVSYGGQQQQVNATVAVTATENNQPIGEQSAAVEHLQYNFAGLADCQVGSSQAASAESPALLLRLSSSLGRELEELCLGSIDLTVDIDDNSNKKEEHFQQATQQLNGQEQTSLNMVDLSHYESQIASINTDLKVFMSEHESGQQDGGLNKILSELVELTGGGANYDTSNPDQAVNNFNFDFLDGFVSTNQLIENSQQQDAMSDDQIQSFDYELQDPMLYQRSNDPMLFANNHGGALVAMTTANMY